MIQPYRASILPPFAQTTAAAAALVERRAWRRLALATLLVAISHVLLIRGLMDAGVTPAAGQRARSEAGRVSLRLLQVPLPVRETLPAIQVVPKAAAVAVPRPVPPRSLAARAEPPRLGTPATTAPSPGSLPAATPAGRNAEPAPITAASDAPASTPAGPSLLDTEATRRAIRASARSTSLARRAAAASGEPVASSAAERLGSAVGAAAKGDCIKGEYAGGGMGLLSLPFLAAAVIRDQCAQ